MHLDKAESLSAGLDARLDAGLPESLQERLQARLHQRLHAAIAASRGWLPFDRFQSMALYEPGLGYYARGSRQFGQLPSSGSDFVTAPEMSPLFGRALARQVGEAMDAAAVDTVYEFGAGSGALAAQLIEALGARLRRYCIVDLSATLRQRQAERLAAWADRVVWLDALPHDMQGVVVGNEVLDAMPVKLLARLNGGWHERGVAVHDSHLVFADQETALRPPVQIDGDHDYLTEIHPQAEAFIATLADRLAQGAAFFIDYGFADSEYYHPQRHMGTLMCHRVHMADTDPLIDLGQKDITAHVNFSGIALAAQEAGFGVLGYTTQARFLMNCGLLDLVPDAPLSDRAAVQKLLAEHEMGELFKVLGLYKNSFWDAPGFSQGDRTERL